MSKTMRDLPQHRSFFRRRLGGVRAPFDSLPLVLAGVFALSSPVAAAPDPLGGRVEQVALARGASPERLAEKHGKLAKNGFDSLSLKLAAKQCVVVAASVDDAVPDVALSLEVKGGPTLSDEASGSGAALRYCAGAVEEKATARVRSEKATRFSLGVWGVTQAAAAAAPAAAAPAPGAPSEANPPEPVSLAKRLQAWSAKRAVGLAAMTPVREEDVSSQEARKREVVLAGDQCYRVVAVGDPPATEIEVSISDAKGAPVASVKGKLEVALPEAKTLCPKASGTYSVAVRPIGGASRVAWQLMGGANPELEARFPVGGKGNQLVATRMRDVHRNQAAKAPVMAFETGELGTAEVHTSTFDVVGGQCYLAVAAGVPSLRALDLEVVDQRGHTVAKSQEQNSISLLKVCAELSGRWTLHAKAFKGYGSFGVQVFQAAQP